jgi:tetratricopeptide (TPR) repeat protein
MILRSRKGGFRWGALVALGAIVLASPSAWAGVNFTSGKVYMQQKVYDKACHFLELARKEEPDNTQVYALLSVARFQQHQYASAGAVFQVGLKVAADKKDKKRQEDIETNRRALYADLFNKGINALKRAGTVSTDDGRTNDAGTPQADLAKERGEPRDFSRFTEGGKLNEFWYYPDQGTAYHFSPADPKPIQIPYKPFQLPAEPAVAVTDTTTFPPYTGASAVAEAAYDFELAMLVDPGVADAYKNLSYVYEVLGRTDDAIHAAQRGLVLKPGDTDLARNLKVAVMGRGNRLFNAKRYEEAIPAYRAAITVDSSGAVTYLVQIADSYQKAAEAIMEKTNPKRAELLNNAALTYMEVFQKAPNDSVGALRRENAVYNAAVIQLTLDDPKKAVTIIDQGLVACPKSKDLLLLAAETKYQTGDYTNAVTHARAYVQIDPKEPRAHAVLFQAFVKLNKKDDSVAEYTLYRALSEGKPRTGSQLKTWIDSADNRLGAGHQLKKTLTAEGYPEEVRTFSDGDKTLESWFYWSKGKSVTFLDGQVFSQASFPPLKQ